MTNDFVHGTHNMLFNLTPAKWLQDLEKSGVADICHYQEAGSSKVKGVIQTFCDNNRRGLYIPDKSGNLISWNRRVFKRFRDENGEFIQGVHDAHLGASDMGINIKDNPPRDFSWVGLRHEGTGDQVLTINVHPVAGATSRESAPDPRFKTPEANMWADWAFGQYWLDVLAFICTQMSTQDPGSKTRTAFWDSILIGGDYNASLDNDREWYYPGLLMNGVLVPDSRLAGLDHLQFTRHSNLGVVDRWSQAANTDHRLHFVKLNIQEVADFPRDR